MPIVPDDKNWTWVLETPCADCGFDAADIDIADLADHIRANVEQWPPLLAHEHATLRPTGDQWSAVEYACHVRDVFRLYDERLRMMLDSDHPRSPTGTRTSAPSSNATTSRIPTRSPSSWSKPAPPWRRCGTR